MAIVADTSLGHPGANFTGLSPMSTDLTAKRLQRLTEALPKPRPASKPGTTPFDSMRLGR